MPIPGCRQQLLPVSVLYAVCIHTSVSCVCLSVCQDAVEEPFVDVAVGGSELAGWEADNLMVWAVTIRGRVSSIYIPALTQNLSNSDMC